VFVEAKDDGGCGDNWTSGAISLAKLQPNHHHQETNIQFLLQPGCPSCCQTNSVKALKGKRSYSIDLFTPSSPGVFQLCLWPLIAPGYVGGWLPCLSSALWCQYLRTLLSGYYKCTASIESTWTTAQRVLHQYLEAMRDLSKLWRDRVMLCYGLCFHWFVCALEHV